MDDYGVVVVDVEVFADVEVVLLLWMLKWLCLLLLFACCCGC